MSKFLDKTGLAYFLEKLKALFVKQEAGKGLSTNDFTTAEKDKLAKLDPDKLVTEQYVLPPATEDTIGGVKPGTDLTVTDDGTQNFSNASGYLKQSDLTTAQDGYVQDSELTTTLEGYVQDADLDGYVQDTDLESYVTETELTAKGYQNASDVQTAIQGAQHLKKEIHETMPETGEDNIIYLVKKAASGDKNVYDEYMWIEEAFEKVGDTEIDLSGYVQTEDLQSITNEEIDAMFSSPAA